MTDDEQKETVDALAEAVTEDTTEENICIG